jgi:peptidoglycan-associated lipoprotein
MRPPRLEIRVTTAKTPALVLILAALLAACSSTPVATPPPPAPPAAAPAAPAPAAAPVAAPAPAPASTVTTVTLPEYLDPKSGLSTARSVYFDFDDDTIKAEYTALVEKHGNFLSGHPAVAIRIEGNTDERGSTEYNLALGQKRAQSVLKALKIYGVKDAQVEAVSWGEEKPRAAGHDESAWAQNRRADLQYPAK